MVEEICQSRTQETLSSSQLRKGLGAAEKDRVGTVKRLAERVNIVVLDSLGALTRTRNYVGNETFGNFDAIYSILAKNCCISLFSWITVLTTSTRVLQIILYSGK